MRIESFSEMWSYSDRLAFPIGKEPLPYMQQLCNGLQVGLTLIAARPLMGASTFAVSLAMHLAKKGRKVLYCAHRQQQIPCIIDRYRRNEPDPNTLNDINFFYAEHPQEKHYF